MRILLAPLLPCSLGGLSCTLISRTTGPESSASIGGVLTTSSTLGTPNTNLGAVPDSAAGAEEDVERLLVLTGASSAPPPAVVAAAVAVVWGPASAFDEEGRPQTKTRREVLSTACCRGLAAEVLTVAVARREAAVASRHSISLSLCLFRVCIGRPPSRRAAEPEPSGSYMEAGRGEGFSAHHPRLSFG